MKNRRTPCFVFVLILWSIPLAGNAKSNYDSTGFEPPTYTTGLLIGQDGWSGSYPGEAAPVVQKEIANAGTQAVAAVRSVTDVGTSIYLNRDFTAISGPVRVHAAMRVKNMAGSGGYFDAFYIYQDSFSANRVTILYFRDNRSITVYDGQSERTVGTWTTNTWYSLEFAIDTAGKTFDLGIGGKPVAAKAAFLDAGVEKIAGVAVQEYGGQQGGGLYFDDVKVEPAGK